MLADIPPAALAHSYFYSNAVFPSSSCHATASTPSVDPHHAATTAHAIPLFSAKLHMTGHDASSCSEFTWRILTTERDFNTRLATETMNIRKAGGNLMNGCEGRHLLPYLQGGSGGL